MASFCEESDEPLPPVVTTRPKFLKSVDFSDDIGADSRDGSETPIFSKRKMTLRIPAAYTGEFTHLTVSKNWLVCLLALNEPAARVTLLRFFLPRAIPPGEIALEKYLAGYKIAKLFLDPTGHHILISLIPKSPGLSADFLYIHGNGPKVRRIEKFKDHEITAVAFNNDIGTETSTGPILLGTSRGLIFETELTLEADKPSYRKQVYDLGLGRPKYPITGLEVLRAINSTQYMVVTTTPDCIYTFQETLKAEERSLQAIFTSYVNGTRMHNAEVVKTDLNYSVLNLFAAPNEKFPTQWGWLCGAGLRHGTVAQELTSNGHFLLGDELIASDKDLEQRKHLSYEERHQNVAKSFVLTEYHALLMFNDHITGICLLNQAVIYEEYFHEQMGRLLNIVRDPFSGAIYVYTTKMVFNYKISDEQRNIWQIYLNKGSYEMAEIYASDESKLNVVLERKARAAFEKADYNAAADIYAETGLAFEEVCLKFIDLEDKRPIIHFVRKRLKKLPPDAEDELLVLVIWLVDLYLTQINFPGRSDEERAHWQREYDSFMQETRVALCTRKNCEVIRNLITQHADTHNLSQFAIFNEDYEEVINQHLSEEKYADALQTLRKQKDVDLYYKYCPIIMEYLPEETISVLMSQGRKLEVEKLIPTLIATDTPKHIAEVLKYLEYSIYNLGESNRSIHNYILQLYAEHQPAKVIKYLENEGHDVSLVHYDIHYCLCICTEFKVRDACVFLQCLLEMWTQAVDLALSFDMSLAKETASKPEDEETRRKLWLRIACHEIKGTNDVKKALELLKECDLLRIEDLLPFFSDFEKIDDFKEPICEALKEYNQKIQELEHDMNECNKQAERVRNELQSVRERCIRVEAHEVCTICESYLLVRPFFLFICGHKFHVDCLEKAVVPMLNTDQSRKLATLKQQLETTITQAAASGEQDKTSLKNREKLKREIEEILAADCLYCGLMIETVDQPFVEDWDQVNVDWE